MNMVPQDDQTPIIKTYLPKFLTTHLPKTRDDDAWGAQVRSHYSAEENNDKLPTNIEALEAEREKRKQNYAQIAHE
jgi:sterol 24-C-methyltransferase